MALLRYAVSIARRIRLTFTDSATLMHMIDMRNQTILEVGSQPDSQLTRI